MGLDHWIRKKVSVRSYLHTEKELELNNKLKKIFKDEEVIEVTFKVIDFRKASAIHNWFVKNVQNGEEIIIVKG